MDKILIVDDAQINREMLRVIFEEQYEIIEASDGDEAIKQIKRHENEIVLIFLDRIMPGKSGIDVLKFMNLRGLIEHIPVIMVTGDNSVNDDVATYEYGAADIIYKPFEPAILSRRAENLIELYKKREKIDEELAERTKELEESRRQLSENNEFLVNALGSIVEFRSAESGEHVQRVSIFTRIILNYIRVNCPEYGLTTADIGIMAQAAALHDVGKIAIADSILNKPGKLTDEEFAEMKKHTIYGCEILERFHQGDSDFFKYCYEICRWHHEKYDGRGYPDGLKGEDIPIWAQAASLADCFDALVNKRVYKDAFPIETAFDMIKQGECGVFSEKMLKCFEMAQPEFTEAVIAGRKNQ